MTAVLAFSNLSAAAPRQRARCSRTGRFVAWSRAAALRSPAAPAVVVLTPAPVATVETPAPVVAAASPLRVIARVAAGLGRWARRVARAVRRVVALTLGSVPAAPALRGDQADRASTPARGWTV